MSGKEYNNVCKRTDLCVDKFNQKFLVSIPGPLPEGAKHMVELCQTSIFIKNPSLFTVKKGFLCVDFGRSLITNCNKLTIKLKFSN